MKEINTVNDLLRFVQDDLAPRIDNSKRWSKIAGLGALIGGIATAVLAIVEIVKLFC